MQNNFKEVRQFLNFDDDDTFYFIQIIKRRKDNPDMDRPETIIREYFVDNQEYLDKKEESIIELCELHNARATIRLNKRSYKKCAHQMLIELAHKLLAGQYKSIKSMFSSVAGKYSADKDKKWILDIDVGDIDFGDPHTMEELRHSMIKHKPEGDKFIKILKSKTGYHVVVKPFDMREFKKDYPTIDIQKDSFTNLYI